MFCINVEARTFVLSIGVSSYQNAENNLTQTTKDAKHFKSLMENHTKDITILTSKYANKDNILEKLRALCNRAQSDDRIIVYFSGHGYPGGIVAHDKIISYDEINELLSKSSAGAKLLIVDACHAGSVKNARNGQGEYTSPSNGNIIYMMSSRSDELSIESPWVGHGYFTQALLKGLHGKADSNKDKKITLSELFNYVFNDVQHSTSKMEQSQHPQLIGSKTLENMIIVDWNKKL